MTVAKGDVTRLGSSKCDKGYNFAYASEKDTVSLLIYDDNMALKHRIELDKTYKVGNVFACRISKESLDRCYYCYDDGERLITDPYAKTITGCDEFGVKKDDQLYVSRVVLDEFDWEGDTPLNYPYDCCIFYKLHVRGFTKSKTSGVKHKGTFEGIIDKIPYLKELGITTVELMPAYEFDETSRFEQLWCEESVRGIYASVPIKTPVNYWGYVKGFHYAPKAAYTQCAASKADYTVEFKRMVKQLHKNGIEVVMEMFFEDETPDMVSDCIRYWVTEYHIDGVHLYGPEIVLRMAASDPVLADTKIITVYWDGKRGSHKHMANYNDGFLRTGRCFLKGDENQLSDFAQMLKSNPAQSANINYMANHNGFTLNDLVSYERKHNEVNGENNQDGENFNYSWNCGEEGNSRRLKVVALRKKQVKNAYMMLLLAAGTPLIMAGDEFGNSQDGNNNPYCIDSEQSWVNWKNSGWAKELTEFVKYMIEYRKRNRILHMPEQLMMSDAMSCGYPDMSYHGSSAWYGEFEPYNRHLGVMYCSRYDGSEKGEYKIIYVAYNMHWEEHTLALPHIPKDSSWNVVMCTDSSWTANTGDEIMRDIRITPRTVIVLEAKIKCLKKVIGNGTQR